MTRATPGVARGIVAALLGCLAASACNQAPPPSTAPESKPDAATPEHPCGLAIEPPNQGAPTRVTYVAAPREGWCSEAEARLGHRVCVHELVDAGTWSQVGLAVAAVDQERTTTYLVPARDDARVPTLFVDSSAFDAPEQSLHFKFLTGAVVGFELLQYQEYLDLVLPPEREWFSGSVTEFIVPRGDNLFGFTVADQGIDPATTITCAQFQQVYDIIGGRIAPGPVAIVPAHDLQRETLARCGLPVHDPSVALEYEAYSQGKRCGMLRRYTPAELTAAETRVEFGWQDILVTCGAPFDVQTVIAGIVTGTRQGELSHLNVRSASRGTPNCYVKNAYDLLAKWEGKLVSLECGPAGATVAEVTPEEATVCNQGMKPDPVVVDAPDLAWTDLVPLLDVPTATADERATALRRFGSKGTNLAKLYQRIDPSLTLDGFLIPVRYYDAFVHDNTWSVDLGAGPEVLSFADALLRLYDDAGFKTDGAMRRQRLLELQQAMHQAPCDPAFMALIETRILATYSGRDDVMVRFRSSSNAEDALRFNGAGLYDSASVCLADDKDTDALGPSICDPAQPNERGVCRGLTVVWASLWNMKAFEERSWYGIDHTKVAMGILVDTRTKGELANIVAFTGNPLLRGDRRYLINSQAGELDVVSAVTGMFPERDLLTIDGTSGLVTTIERARGSSELPEGRWVLDDAQLQALGRHLATIGGLYPADVNVPVIQRWYLDTEWKVLPDGQLIIKQVRPFLEMAP